MHLATGLVERYTFAFSHRESKDIYSIKISTHQVSMPCVNLHAIVFSSYAIRATNNVSSSMTPKSQSYSAGL